VTHVRDEEDIRATITAEAAVLYAPRLNIFDFRI
jgi:hypothetical protein